MAFKMQLHEGYEEEYKKRHNALNPALRDLLKSAGIAEYSIFFDRDTNILFGVMQYENEQSVEQLAGHPVMKKWWAYMKDIMQTNPDHSPVTVTLTEVFYLP